MHEKDYWDARYKNGGNSGYGSYDEQLTKKLHWLQGFPISSIVEYGCGDFNFGKNLTKQYPSASYLGMDVSNFIIQRNKKLYTEHTFKEIGEIPPTDLLLCVDVLFHILDDKRCGDVLDALYNADWKYLAVTAYERQEFRNDHVRIRPFDYKRFGEPIIREIVEEDGSLYFYLFKR